MSAYRRAEGVPPLRISGYPKRRRSSAADTIALGSNPSSGSPARPLTSRSTRVGDICYADFFVETAQESLSA